MDINTVEIDLAIQSLTSIKNTLIADVPIGLATVMDPAWPEAMPSYLLDHPTAEQLKEERAQGIIELIVEEVQNLKVLDFGCGEGYLPTYAAEKGANLAVGYDLHCFNGWVHKSKLVFTTSLAVVKEHGPYDVITIIDVIDHLEQISGVECLKIAGDLLAPNGKIFLRTHPFSSRHATHLHHHLNKAFLHLVFAPDELKQIVPDQKYVLPNHGDMTPLLSYAKMFEKAGLVENSRCEIKEPVEDFFRTPWIAQRIQRLHPDEFPSFQMSLQILDYVLTRP